MKKTEMGKERKRNVTSEQPSIKLQCTFFFPQSCYVSVPLDHVSVPVSSW